MSSDNFKSALKQKYSTYKSVGAEKAATTRPEMITQQELDEIIETKSLATNRNGIGKEDFMKRKQDYKDLRSKYDKRVSKDILDKLLREDNRSHKNLG